MRVLENKYQKITLQDVELARLTVNNHLITETTGRQEQDQAQFKNVRLYQ